MKLEQLNVLDLGQGLPQPELLTLTYGAECELNAIIGSEL